MTAVARVLLTRRMLGGLALAVAFAVACVLLGRWQWGRYEDKQVRAAAVMAHYSAAPVPLDSVTSRLPLGEDDEWLRVTATGRYVPSEQLLVRNRVQDGTPGMEVLVPLDLDSPAGARLLVDRGWVANADSAAQLPSVPGAPDGPIMVQGWLRPSEPSLDKQLPRGQLASVSVGDAQAQAGGGPLLDGYLVMESENVGEGTAPARPAALAAPETDLGPHQAYAFQWWLTALFGFVFLGYRVRVALAERDVLDGGAPPLAAGEPAPPQDDADDLVLAGRAARPAKPPKPKKVRIWDEEDG